MIEGASILVAVILQYSALWTFNKSSPTRRSTLTRAAAIIAATLSIMLLSFSYGVLAGVIIAISLMSLLGILFCLLSSLSKN